MLRQQVGNRGKMVSNVKSERRSSEHFGRRTRVVARACCSSNAHCMLRGRQERLLLRWGWVKGWLLLEILWLRDQQHTLCPVKHHCQVFLGVSLVVMRNVNVHPHPQAKGGQGRRGHGHPQLLQHRLDSPQHVAPAAVPWRSAGHHLCLLDDLINDTRAGGTVPLQPTRWLQASRQDASAGPRGECPATQAVAAGVEIQTSYGIVLRSILHCSGSALVLTHGGVTA